MGTRGLFGFRYKGKWHVVYNHFDSYQSGLGVAIAREIAAAGPEGIAKWREVFDNESIVIVSESEDDGPEPTPKDVARLASYTDTTVSTKSLDDWYVLTRGCQGSLVKVMESGYLLNHVDAKGKPMWQVHAYIVDLDHDEFQHFVGSSLARARRLDKVTATMFDDDLDIMFA